MKWVFPVGGWYHPGTLGMIAWLCGSVEDARRIAVDLGCWLTDPEVDE